MAFGKRTRLQTDLTLRRVFPANGTGIVLACSKGNLGNHNKEYAVKLIHQNSGYDIGEISALIKVPKHVNLVKYSSCWEDECYAQELTELKRALYFDWNYPKLSLPAGQISLRMVCIQMELCNDDLRRWLHENGYVREEATFSIFLQLAAGIEHLHANQVLHRNLKPENIFVENDGGYGGPPKVKIGDWGIATATDQRWNSNGPSQTGSNSRTALYCAPEQSSGSSWYGEPGDLYALGLIFFELLHPRIQPGFHRHSLDPLQEGLTDVRERRTLPTETQERWPAASQLILQLTATDPTQRPSCMRVREIVSGMWNWQNNGNNDIALEPWILEGTVQVACVACSYCCAIT